MNLRPSQRRRRTVTLALPGDADAVVGFETRLAVDRDDRLNRDEFEAKSVGRVCAFIRERYPWYPKCTFKHPCYNCKELK